MATTEVVVGRIGRAHGVRGEVSVELRTDEPSRRYAEGAVLRTRSAEGAAPHEPGGPPHLTVRGTRWHQSRLLVTFAELPDRTAAETVRGLTLVTDVDTSETPDDPAEFYDHQLVGLTMVTTDGVEVGEVTEVVHGAAQDLLAVRTDGGREVLVPFVTALVPVVDVAAGQVQVADRPGLLAPLDDSSDDSSADGDATA
ncbi:MAG TPA: ribosome maturation factor RimM [Nocardioidaceae bacterium]|nr:ribosome maturation factor RimM [Nocardioidaceae bacterium]